VRWSSGCFIGKKYLLLLNIIRDASRLCKV
jgi:hypothetical protein